MTKEKAIDLLDNLIGMIEDNQESDYDTALKMGIQSLSQEPCDVSVSEKEPNEITEEVTLRFFKNSLKVRWHDFVIYNVEWLKKNWQMEMDIVCGVKPCDDAISREAVQIAMALDNISDIAKEIKSKLPSVQPKPTECEDAISRDAVNNLQKYRYNCGDTSITCVSLKSINELPSVTQKSGKWIRWREEVQRGTHYTENIPHCKCSECDTEYDIFASRFINYCPNCGAKMVEPQESEE